MSPATKALGVALMALVGVGVAAPAYATDPQPAGSTSAAAKRWCDANPHTVVSHLVNRPDNGHGTPEGTPWALLTMDRTTTIHKVEATQPKAAVFQGVWSYQAVVVDKGTLVTNGGDKLSPNKGQKLTAGVQGKVEGGFTVDFTAPACFVGYEGSKLAGTYSGKNPAATADWVPIVWGGEGIQITTNLDANYKWTYTTCSESWLDAYNNNDGQAAGAGDITGKACPVTPTPSASAGGVVPIVLPTTSAPTPAVTPVASGLPVTGSNPWPIVTAGAVLLAGGTAALFLTRRRRQAEAA